MKLQPLNDRVIVKADEELDMVVGGWDTWKSGSDPRTCPCDKESKIER